MEIKMQIKSTWWWKPALNAVYVGVCCRLISIDTASKLASAIANNAFKYRIGKTKKWRRIDGIQVSLERQ